MSTSFRKTKNNDSELTSDLQVIFDTVTAFIYFKDKDCRYVRVNKALADLTGIPAGQWNGKLKQDIFPGYNLPDNDSEILKSGRTMRGIIEMLPLSDGIKWIQSDKIPHFDAEGNVTGVISIATDITGKKAAEEALKDCQEQYDALFERSMECVYIHDFEGNFTKANSAALEMLGYSHQEITELNFCSLLPADEVPAAYEVLNEIRSSGTQKEPTQFRVKRKDGKYVYVETKASLIYRNSKPYAVQGIARDITSRKKAEEAVIKSEVFFRSVWEYSMDGMRIIDGSGMMILVNEAFCRLIGKPKEELLGKHFSYIYNNYSEEAISVSNQRLSTHSIAPYLVRELQLWDNRSVWFELSNNFLEYSDEQVLLLSIFRDITERKKAEEALTAERDLIKSIFESSPDAIMIVDPQGQMVNCNTVTLELLGVPEREKIIGKNFLELVSWKDRERAAENLKYTIEHGVTKDIEYTIVNSKGHRISVEVSAGVVSGESGRLQNIVLVGKDITRRKLEQEQLKKYSEELRETNATKDKFFSIISHDLRSPFQGLLGISDLLVSDNDNLTREEISILCKQINKSLKNQFKLLENLLQWSRIQTGRMKYTPVQVDLKMLVNDIIYLLSGNSMSKSIAVKNEIPQNCIVLADTSMLSSIIQNLITNAIKFTKKYGEIKISAEKKGKFIEVQVADNGVGMKQEDAKRLFRIDQHHSSPGTENESGTGLGLILCREMIERNGGKIWVETEAGRGTTFFFTIPKFHQDWYL